MTEPQTGNTQAPTSHTLVIEREFGHPPEKIWRALTEGALLREWLMDNDFEPVAGRGFTLRSTPVPGWDGIIRGEVLTVEPEARLAYTWQTMGAESVVSWTLVKTAAGTLLRMEQTGFSSVESREYKGATYGWQNFLNRLDGVAGGLA